MSPSDVLSHSFVIRIWFEQTAEEAGQVQWRGQITHIPGEERRYVTNLVDVITFIAPFLSEMGVRLGIRSRLLLRLSGLCRSKKRKTHPRTPQGPVS